MSDIDPAWRPSTGTQAVMAGQLARLLASGEHAGLPPIRWTVREDQLLIVGSAQTVPAATRRSVWQGWADVATGLRDQQTETPTGAGLNRLAAYAAPGSDRPGAVLVTAYVPPESQEDS